MGKERLRVKQKGSGYEAQAPLFDRVGPVSRPQLCSRLESDDLASEAGSMNDNLPIAKPTSAAAPRSPPAPMSREHIVVREVVARSPEDRPVRDTVDGIAEWLVGPARHIVSGCAFR